MVAFSYEIWWRWVRWPWWHFHQSSSKNSTIYTVLDFSLEPLILDCLFISDSSRKFQDSRESHKQSNWSLYLNSIQKLDIWSVKLKNFILICIFFPSLEILCFIVNWQWVELPQYLINHGARLRPHYTLQDFCIFREWICVW